MWTPWHMSLHTWIHNSWRLEMLCHMLYNLRNWGNQAKHSRVFFSVIRNRWVFNITEGKKNKTLQSKVFQKDAGIQLLKPIFFPTKHTNILGRAFFRKPNLAHGVNLLCSRVHTQTGNVFWFQSTELIRLSKYRAHTERREQGMFVLWSVWGSWPVDRNRPNRSNQDSWLPFLRSKQTLPLAWLCFLAHTSKASWSKILI